MISVPTFLYAKNNGKPISLKNEVDVVSYILGKKNGGGGGREIPFTSSVAPTSWTVVSTTDVTGENEYGAWEVISTNTPVSGHGILLAVDGNVATYSQWAARTAVEITIILPEGITIKPSEVWFYGGNVSQTSSFSGYNPETEEWETLGSGISYTSETPIETDKYFSKFRLNAVGRTIRVQAQVFEISVTEGVLMDKR